MKLISLFLNFLRRKFINNLKNIIMRTIQIFDDGFEALYSFNDDVTDKQIKLYYKEYLEQQDEYFDSFEDFM